MVTLVLVDEVEDLALVEEFEETERDLELDQIETASWSYRMPCAGVRYYSYQQDPSPEEQIDPWAIDALTSRI